MRENIVFYVHMTGLLGYFIDPICEYLSKNKNITILHLNKRHNFHYFPQDNRLYEFVDISDYSISEIKNKLQETHPQAVIFVSFISIYEFMMIRICKDLGLKTIYQEHGIYSHDTSHLGVPVKGSFSKAIGSFSRLLYYLRKYISFSLGSHHPFNELSVFVNCVIKKRYYLSKFDKALFFAEYGFSQINKFFDYTREEIEFTGYPLTNSNNDYLKLKEISKMPIIDNKEAVLIHQPFILDNRAIWTYDEEAVYYQGIDKMLRGYGYHLTIAIHPREDYHKYAKLLENTGINVVKALKSKDYKEYSLALGYYSTALLIPIFFNIPILLVDYPNVFKTTDSVFYPASINLDSINNIEFGKNRQFIENYIGIGCCSFENVATILNESINSFHLQ